MKEAEAMQFAAASGNIQRPPELYAKLEGRRFRSVKPWVAEVKSLFASDTKGSNFGRTLRGAV